LRFKIILAGLKDKVIKRDHYYLLLGLIYKIMKEIEPEFSDWLHNQGFLDGNKRFKFFNFSRLLNWKEKIEIINNGKDILFKDNIAWFYISSPVKKFAENLTKFLLLNKNVKIGNLDLEVISARAILTEFSDRVETFKTITPIILSKRVETFEHPFYIRAYQSPDEFDHYITKNALEKWKIFSGGEPKDYKLEVDREYLKTNGKRTACKVYFSKDQILVGSNVPVKVYGDKQFIEFLYDVGLGEKNSMGFGMVEKVGLSY